MSSKKKVEEIWKELSPEDHVLLKPGMYLGAVKKQIQEIWVFNGEKMQLEEIEFLPAFLKLFDEIVSNSVDESKRKGTKLNKIKVTIDGDKISVWDNGGIPIVIHKDKGQYLPEMLFSSLRTGSNFDESEERIVVGTNGLGSVLVNIFSKEFQVSTCDGKKMFYQTFTENMKVRQTPKITQNKQNHTKITYLTDFERLGMTGIDETHYKLIYKRCQDLAAINPEIEFYFNDEKIKFNSFADYVGLYTDNAILESGQNKNWKLAIAPSESGFRQISFVNCANTLDGGTHVDYIMNQIVLKIREFFSKRHKVDIKPSDIKNKIMLFLDAQVINPMFNSQTKEKLITESKDFGQEFQVSDKFINSILKSEIVNLILDWVNQKKIADESKLARELNKNLSKIKVEKLIDAKGSDRWKCQLGIYEGLSAVSSFRKYRDPQTMGAFSLKGKFINVSEITTRKLMENEEAISLMVSLGLKIGEEPNIKNLRYGRILFLTDADFDGNSISALLINFLNKYWPKLFEMNMVYKVETPIVSVVENKKSAKKMLFYQQSEYNDWAANKNLQNFEIKYKKGLAALVDDEYEEIIRNPKLTLIKKDELSDNSLDIWFGKNSEPRKREILNMN